MQLTKEAIAARLAGMTDTALNTLRSGMESGPWESRVATAKSVLEYSALLPDKTPARGALDAGGLPVNILALALAGLAKLAGVEVDANSIETSVLDAAKAARPAEQLENSILQSSLMVESTVVEEVPAYALAVEKRTGGKL